MSVQHSLKPADPNQTRPDALRALDHLYQPVESEMQTVRDTVQETWSKALRLVHGPDLPAVNAGGKLLRPALCLLSAGAAGVEDRRPLVRLAAALELLHVAALIHDDVIDSALVRRGNSSLNAIWDDRAAVLGGDYLVSLAIQEIAAYGCCPLVSDAIDCIRHMAEGELTIFGRGYEGFSLEDNLRLIHQKTAVLFEVACAAATHLQVNARYHQPLKKYGHALGMAFQLVDDLLDLLQSEETMGKPSCGDVVEGKRTAPLIFMREGLTIDALSRLDAMVGKSLSESDRQWIAGELERTGAHERTLRLTESYANKARAALAQLPASIYRDSMESLVDFAVVRSS
jgi:octaprenyl-diphosphate synthase